MVQAIVYQNENGGVSVMYPADINIPLLETGMKDVPKGIPFWIISADDLPSDAPQEAWEIDYENLPEPDGHGGTIITQQNDEGGKNNDQG
ncbi:hypothetical protein ACOJCD_002422 [Cronobacter dublinensis]